MPPLRSRAAWVLVALAAALATTAAAQPAVLLDAAPPPTAARLAPEAGHAARARYVRLDLDALNDDALTLDLFDGERVTVTATRVEHRGPGRMTWRGHVGGRPAEPVSLTVEGGAASGRVVAGGRVYLLSYAGAGRHVLYEYAEAEGVEACHTLPADEAADEEGARGEGAPPAPWPSLPAPMPVGDAEPLDLMVVYTGAVAAALGEGVAPYLQSLLDVLNASFAAAGTPHTARLVHAREVAYDEDPERGLDADVARLRARSDGHLDEVHAWRNERYADAVVLLVEEGADYCGVAYLMTSLHLSFARSAFAVVKRGCALGGLNFAHEVGHLLGIRHDVYVDAGSTPAPYAHGFVNTAPAANPPFRTVLAYADRCIALGIACPLVPAFSTTAVTLGGDALGDATADAARVFEESVPIAVGFRDAGAPPPVISTMRLTATEGEPRLIDLKAFIREQIGDHSSLLGVNPPTAGTIDFMGNFVVYTPPLGFLGTATLTYAFLDVVGREGEGLVEVEVQPSNVAPSEPQLLEPPNNAPLTVFPTSGETLAVTWTPAFDANGDALAYTWQLFEHHDARRPPLLEVRAPPTATDHIEIPHSRLAEALGALGVPEGTTRYLHHRVSVSDGEAIRYSRLRALQLVSSTPRFGAHTRPNPTRGPLVLSLDLPEDAALHLTLYDVLGRAVRQLETEAAAGHARPLPLDVDDLPAGHYLYRLRVAFRAAEAELTGRFSVRD